MSEVDFMRRCMKRATEAGARLFRQNTGQAWVGESRRNADGSLTLKNPRPFHAGATGMSDLIGWVPVVVTAEMVGSTIAVYTAVETKAPRGRVTTEQRAFIAAVEKSGGRAGIAKTDADLDQILRPEIAPRLPLDAR